MKVLLVAGSPRVSAQVASALLGRPDVELVEVGTARAALRRLDGAERFDVVAADNDTHPTGGLALARELHARRSLGLPAPPAVLLLARAQDVWLARSLHAHAWVLKPVDPLDIAEVLDALAAGRPLPALPGVGGDLRAPQLEGARAGMRAAAGTGS